MSFDITKHPTTIDDNWLAEAIIEKLGRDNLLEHNEETYYFEVAWKRLDRMALANTIRKQISELNALRASANLKILTLSANRVKSVVELVKMSVHAADQLFNLGEPNTLGCKNGDLVLLNGEWGMQHPVREHYRLCRIPHEYKPSAKAPRFDDFLNEIFAPDSDAKDKRELLLQMMGYALMTHCQYERFLFAVGNGANGKSVAFNVMKELAGSHNIAAVHPNLFNNSHHRAQLDQKLLNIITESEQGGKLPAADIKALVSGETMTVDRKFKDPFEMHPIATIFWATNHMPHPSDYSDALFRRANILTFNRTFLPHERDPKLYQTLRDEMPGILNMVLAAYARAVRQGFVEPESSIAAKNDWRIQSDAVALWLSECEKNAEAELSVTICYEAFRKWATSAGISHPPSKKSFSQRLERLGIQKHKTAQGMIFRGISVAPTEERLG